MARPRKPRQPNGPPPWMTTFSDMTTLLLTFFVLLISMATFNPVKFAQVLGYYQTTTGVGYNIPTPNEPVTTEDFFVQIVRASAIRQKTPEGGYKPSLAGENLKVQSFRDNFVVQFTERPFFERFDARLTAEGRRRLEALATRLREGVNVIHVVGRVSNEEDEAGFDALTEIVALRNGTTVRVLSAPLERFAARNGRVSVNPGEVALIQTRAELAAKRAETTAEFLVACGIDARRIRQAAGEARKPAEETAPAGSFVFSNGGDTGRTVEIVVTGEIVND